MSWSAKPKYGYNVNSTEAVGNIFEVYYQLNGDYNYTKECVAGVLGNVQSESGFNPWRWQGDSVGTSKGYGLFQYTPASGYLALPGVTPNMSVTTQTTGATPEDGARQVEVFASNELSKWVPSAWRPYWSTSTYSSLYAKRGQWLSIWGDGSSITMSQFSQITDIEAATFFHLACFEGPSIPSQDLRYNNALVIYEILGGVPPVPPHPPSHFKLYLLKAMKNARDNKRSADI